MSEMRIKDIAKSKAHEVEYRGEVIAEGLRNMAQALADEAGSVAGSKRRLKPGRQFPFESALSRHVEHLEVLYRGLLEAAPDAMLVVNANGELVLLNAQAEQQFGYSRDELIGQLVTNIIPEGFAERLVKHSAGKIDIRAEPDVAPGAELFGRRKDGSEFPIEIMFSRLDGPEGPLLTAAIRNISVRKAAQKRLAQVEGRYRGLLEAAPDAMIVANKRGKIVLLNRQADELFNYGRDELLGQRLTNIIPEEFIDRLITESSSTAADAGPRPGAGIELLGRRRDGSDFPLEAMLSTLQSPEGMLVTIAVRDISLRRAAELRMTQMEGRYRGLLEAAPDAMIVVHTEGDIVLLNAQAERKFGYSRDELLGQQVSSIIPQGLVERLAPDTLNSAENALALQTGMGIELAGIKKDGTRFPLEIAMSPLAGDEGTLVTLVVRDISLRKAAPGPSHAEQVKYRGILEAAPDALVVSNTDGVMVLVNAETERLFGYGRQELLGQEVEMLMPERFRQRHPEHRHGYTAQPHTRAMGEGLELSGLRKDGSEFPIEISLSPIETPEGTLISSAIRDVTNRKQIEHALKASEAKFRALLESAPDAIIVSDANSQIQLANAEAERLYGYTSAELIGMPSVDLLGERFRPAPGTAFTTRPDGQPRPRSAGGAFEAAGRRKDGTEFPIEFNLSVVEAADGPVYIGVVRDTTQRHLAEQALRDSEERHRIAVEVAGLGTWEWDMVSDQITWSETFHKMFGFTSEQKMSFPAIRDRLHPDDVPDANRVVQDVIDGRAEGYDIEYRVVWPDGSTHWMFTRSQAERDTAGKAVRLKGVTMDISARKEAEQALRLSDARVAFLVDGVKDYAIFMLDPGGNIVSWGRGAELLKGYKADEIVGRNFSCFYPPEDAATGKPAAELRSAVATGRYEEEGWRIRKDGSRFWAHVVITSLRDELGQLQGFAKVSRDITAQRSAAAALRESEERNRMAVEVAGLGSWSWDIKADSIAWSPTFHRLWGLTSETELSFGTVRQRVHPDDLAAIDAAVKGTMDGGLPYEVEYRIFWPDGSTRWIVSRGAAEFDEAGKPAVLRGVSMDVTARREAEQERQRREMLEHRAADLSRSNDDLQQFAYIAAHDLQEPLRMVASYTQLLAQRYKGKMDADADDFIGYAVDGAHRMQALITDLLAYCRVGTTGKELREIPSETALENALFNLRAAIAESGAVITHDALPVVNADLAQLSQLFQNLVGNAIKYRGAELPRIHVGVSHQKNEWVFSVSDNGLGIDPQYFEKIFVMFQRLHARDQYSGTGIGLTLCKKIAERHGGSMSVQSEPGKGSTFYLAIPDGAT